MSKILCSLNKKVSKVSGNSSTVSRVTNSWWVLWNL